MANFRVHASVAAFASGALATTLLATGVATPVVAGLCFIGGLVGGILPDIDSDHSTPTNIVFGLLSVVCAATLALFLAPEWPLFWVWVMCAIGAGLCQWALRPLFTKYTRHRGVFHSLLAAALFGLIAVNGLFLVGFDEMPSWLVGASVTFGFLVHLLLDEIYSVDFMGGAFKKSFGSAFKLWQNDNLKGSLAMLAAVGLLYWAAPNPSKFVDTVSNERLYQRIAARMW